MVAEIYLDMVVLDSCGHCDVLFSELCIKILKLDAGPNKVKMYDERKTSGEQGGHNLGNKRSYTDQSKRRRIKRPNDVCHELGHPYSL